MFMLCAGPPISEGDWQFITPVLCGRRVNRGTHGLEAAGHGDAPAASLTFSTRPLEFQFHA